MNSAVTLKESFSYQADFCRSLHAPFVADILDLCAVHYNTSDILKSAIGDWQGNPVEEAFPLRLLGAWHALVLQDKLDWVSASGGALWQRLEQAIVNNPDHFARYIASPPQTNEVGRSAALMLGFLDIAAHTDKPLALYEIGTSAGLNLRWDKYQYWSGGQHIWGDKSASTKILTEYEGTPKLTTQPIHIADRYGCDIAPIDITVETSRDRLRSYVWHDHALRRHTLESAIDTSLNVPAKLTKLPAGEWVKKMLGADNPDHTTVLFHSIMWMYLPTHEQDKIIHLINERGQKARKDSPFFYLALEFFDGITAPASLVLTSWPGGDKKTIATANPHCTKVTIL